MELAGKRVGLFIENNHNDHEVWYPLYRFREAGAKVSVIGPVAQRYTSKLGQTIEADQTAEAVKSLLYDALIVPGGYAPDLMRLNKPMVGMIRHHAANGRIIAAICHGSWMLASANIIKGKRVTGAPSIKDDLINAGGRYEDSEVVSDGGIVTSRKPDDLPAFCREILRMLTTVPMKASA